MLLIALAASTVVCFVGACVLLWAWLTVRAAAAEAEFRALGLGKHLKYERGEHSAAIEVLYDSHRREQARLHALLEDAREEARRGRERHAGQLEALRAEHAAEKAALRRARDNEHAAATAYIARYDALTDGHEFHKGGKVAAHGDVRVLYNCVTCPPEANVRLLAPRGFFAPEAEGDDGET